LDQLPRPPDLIDFDGCGDARADAQRARYSEDLGFLDLLPDLDLRQKPRDEGAEHDVQGPDDGLLDERGAEKDACADEDVDRQVAENVGNRVVMSTRTKYRGVIEGEAACRKLARALVAAAERRGLLFDKKVRTLQMMRDRSFSEEVLDDWRQRNAEEAEAAEAEEGNV
jgi:hypothetical protein